MNLNRPLSWSEIPFLLAGTAVGLVAISWLLSGYRLWFFIGLVLLLRFVLSVLDLRRSLGL